MSVFSFLKRGGKRAARNKPPGRARSYQAAIVDRLTKGWTTSNAGATAELRYALRPLRARSRELCRNNDYARKFIRMTGANIIGPNGVKLQVRARDDDDKLDKFANDQIERHFGLWGRLGVCTVDGTLSWLDAQNLFIKSVATDGEIIVRFVRGAAARNDYGFALQFLEADHLDEDLNLTLKNGNKIQMGVEFDAWRRPVAYHLLDDHPGATVFTSSGRRFTRVPAEEILHLFVADRADQARGVPWMASGMAKLNMLGGYEEAELVAARLGASKMGFFTSPDGDGYAGDGDDAAGNLTMEAEPGLFEQLPAGVGISTFDPTHPNGNFAPFTKSMLRGFASGVGVSYNSLANDLEGVNFSSIRHGSLDERDQWRCSQEWAIEHFHNPIFEAWLLAFLSSSLATIPVRKFAKFNTPVWSPRGWQWVDPLKEVKANAEAVRHGFKSKTDVLSEQGRDLEETLDQLVHEMELFEAAGLTLNPTPATLNPLPEGQKNDENDDD